MKLWIKLLSVFLFFSLIFLPKNIEARSGCCSHHGGVCGCGCCDGTSLSSTCAPYYPECNGGGYSSGYQAPPSCPSMSSYNSVSGQCECYSGYVASGSLCISIDQWCKNKYGYNSEHDYSSDGCKCRYGYVWNGSKTACISEYEARPTCPLMATYNSVTKQCECMSGYIASGNSCISEDQSCKNKYGYNSKSNYNGQCECRYGYAWNSAGTKCVSQDEVCQNEFGYNSKATISGDKCECKYGYTWNKANNKCISKDSACQELNGVMSRSNLSGGCECLSGYEYDGSECVFIKKNIETKYTENEIDTANPIIVKKEISPTPTLTDISPMPSFEPTIKETNSNSHFDPIGNFLVNFFLGFLIKK